jgi:plastocyanin
VRRLAIAAAAVAACAVLVPAVAGAGTGATRTVTIHDDYFSPAKTTVKAGTTIKWVFPEGLTNTHDVMLSKGPKGVPHFMSDYAAGGYVFKRKLTKRGTYAFVCELHQEMKSTIVVR